jgi:hypothetical protein
MNFKLQSKIIGLGSLITTAILGQSADVSPPAQRKLLVESAVQLWANRGVLPTIPDSLVNPFEFAAEVPVEPSVDSVTVPTTALTGVELLSKLCLSIPASGTVVLGGESILLLGQKRLKVGDTITINFEGRNYDLYLETIGSTTFTVRLGSLVHTRSTYISSSSRP